MIRRTMLPPMRPSPTIPNCIVIHSCPPRASPLPGGERESEHRASYSAECAACGAVNCGEAVCDLTGDVRTQHAAPAFGEHAEIAARLRRPDLAEACLAAGDGKVLPGLRRDLKEHAGIRPALICLPGRMQEARPELGTGRDMLAVAHRGAQFLQDADVPRVALDISKRREIIARVQAREVGAQPTLE